MTRLLFPAWAAALGGCCGVRPAEDASLPRGAWVVAGGERLHVRQMGEGPGVVLLHGLGDSGIGWRALERPLVEAGYRVTILDALGAGRSAKPEDGDYSIEGHVARLGEVVDRLGIARPLLVGHSLGGSVALAFAQRRPETVRALALLDPGAYREGATGDQWFWDAPLLAEVVLGVMPTCSLVRYGLRQNFHDPSRIPEALEADYLCEASREGAIDAFIAQERQKIPPDPEGWEAGHRRLRLPVLIVWGVEDGLVPAAQGLRLAAEVPGARLVLLSGVGHSPHLEAPERVLEDLLPFLLAH